MTRVDLTSVACSIARTTAALPDAWSWLIVRDLAAGMSRFDDLATDLGISRKVLTQRLSELQANGVVTRTPYQHKPVRFHYSLTEQGRDLLPILMAMVAWGDRWRPTGQGPPARFSHQGCDGGVEVALHCDGCGQHVTAAQLTPLGGPGGQAGPGTALIGRYLGDYGSATPSEPAVAQADSSPADSHSSQAAQ